MGFVSRHAVPVGPWESECLGRHWLGQLTSDIMIHTHTHTHPSPIATGTGLCPSLSPLLQKLNSTFSSKYK